MKTLILTTTLAALASACCLGSAWAQTATHSVRVLTPEAAPHTPDTATNKAWTAVSFRSNTSELAKSTQAGQPSSGIRQVPRFVGLGGGMLIEAAGSIVGAIGVVARECDVACR